MTTEPPPPPLGVDDLEAICDRLLKHWLMEACQHTGTSTAQLAEQSRLPATEIAASLSGERHLAAARLHTLAGALGVSAAELMDALPSMSVLAGRYA